MAYVLDGKRRESPFIIFALWQLTINLIANVRMFLHQHCATKHQEWKHVGGYLTAGA